MSKRKYYIARHLEDIRKLNFLYDCEIKNDTSYPVIYSFKRAEQQQLIEFIETDKILEKQNFQEYKKWIKKAKEIPTKKWNKYINRSRKALAGFIKNLQPKMQHNIYLPVTKGLFSANFDMKINIRAGAIIDMIVRDLEDNDCHYYMTDTESELEALVLDRSEWKPYIKTIKVIYGKNKIKYKARLQMKVFKINKYKNYELSDINIIEYEFDKLHKEVEEIAKIFIG